MGKTHVKVVKMSKKLLKLLKYAQKCVHFEAKMGPMRQNLKKWQNFCLKCSHHYAEQSPPRFQWVKTMLMWSKCRKTAQIVEKC